MGIDGMELLNNSVADSHDETDVPAALERSTQDGSGFMTSHDESELPDSNYEDDLLIEGFKEDQ